MGKLQRIPLLGGAYQSRSLISGAQRCINLYPEINKDPQAPTQVTHYPTPGLTLRGTPPNPGTNRCLYRASNSALYTVINRSVYLVSPVWVFTLIGTLNVDLPSPVSMIDNGLVAVIVDGTGTGYAVNLDDNSFGVISDLNFYGGTRADYVDTFFTFNTPGTTQWQISLPLVTYDNLVNGVITPGNLYAAFDPLDVAGKTSNADPLQTVIVMHGNPWLLGVFGTSEIWYDSGAADFAFARVPNAVIEHGCIAPYSVTKTDTSIFWLAQDRQGKGLVLRGNADYSVEELSSSGIATIIQGLDKIDDAIGFCYQQNDHAFYVLTFPTANRTFAVELATKQWHELAWTNADGNFNRHRANCAAFVNNEVVVGDWQNGNIYHLDSQAFTDAGIPITRLRTVPHMLADGRRMRINQFMADLQGGTLTSAIPDNPPKVFLRVSVDRGGSFGNAVQGNFGAAGDYGQFPFWRNLGYARDFVFELSWSEPINTALNGGFWEGDVEAAA